MGSSRGQGEPDREETPSALPPGTPLKQAGPGEWLRPRIDAEWKDMHAVVPRGFEAYARIFHPVQRDWPKGSGWDRQPSDGPAEPLPIVEEIIGWAAVAEAFGTVMHPLAQFDRMISPSADSPYGRLDAAGRRYSEPAFGNLPPEVLARVARHLAADTSAPDAGVAGIWEGYGGLTSSAGYAQLTAVWDEPDGPDAAAGDGGDGVGGGGAPGDGRAAADGGPPGDGAAPGDGGAHGPGPGESADPPPGSGLLPADVVLSPTLDLPGRSYYLFSAGARFFQDVDWVHRVPWHHAAWSPQSPNLLWPADHAWVLVSEIDFDSTVVAGSRELIAALVQDPNIEALPLREGADLSWDADDLNRPELY